MKEISWQIRAGIRRPEKAMNVAFSTFKTKYFWKHFRDRLNLDAVESTVPFWTTESVNSVRDQLVENGIEVNDMKIDSSDFYNYLELADYSLYKYYYAGGTTHNFLEKVLEHYICMKLINLKKNDDYIDVANGDSPVPFIYEKLSGCNSYLQDMYFKSTRGRYISGDAGKMDIPDGFADALGLHCSFDHFEGSADSNFILEAQRILKPGGRLCIVPLYMYSEFANQLDPTVIPCSFKVDEGAKIFLAKGFKNRFGRFYDMETFKERVLNNCNKLNLKIFHITNARDFYKNAYVDFAALFERI